MASAPIQPGELLLASFLYAALTLVLAWPLSVHPASRVLWMGADTPLFAWTLAWDVHALTHHPLSIFDANIFSPERRTLAYSENLIGSAFFAAPVLWLTDNPFLAVNVVALLSCVLCGLGAWFLARRVGVGPLGSLLAGIVFAFSPPRFLRLSQLHLTAVQWIPFALAFLHGYLETGRRRELRLAAACFTLQALASGHGAVFLLLGMGGLLAYRVALGEPLAPLRRVRDLGLVGILLLLPAAALVLPYNVVQREEGLRRFLDPDWWTDWRPAAASFLASPTHLHKALLNLAGGRGILEIADGYFFPGYIPLLLAGALALPRVKAARVRLSRIAFDRAAAEPPAPPAVGVTETASRLSRSWAVMASVLSWLAVVIVALIGLGSLGLAAYVAVAGRITVEASGHLVRVHNTWRPVLVAIALFAAAGGVVRVARLDVRKGLRRLAAAWRTLSVHRRDARVFYALLSAGALWLSMGAPLGAWPLLYSWPGFNFIRVPGRFTILALVGLSVLAGFGFDRLAAARGRGVRLALAGLLGACLVGEFFMAPLETKAFTLPIPPVDRWLDTQPKPFVVVDLPFSNEGDHAIYMVYSTAHFQKTVNGYSGFLPPRHADAYPLIRRFPELESLETLARLGVTYVVVHTERFKPRAWPQVEEGIARAGGWLVLEHAEGTGRVYSLHPQRGEVRTEK